MKCTIPEIAWHNRDPILSLDIQFSSQDNFYRLASGGTDHHVLIWQLLIRENGGITVEMLCDLDYHIKSVNAVRFSPDGNILCSADDDSAIYLWKKNEEASYEVENKENWGVLRRLKGHLEDIHDLCWSSCSQFLLTGSVDNTAILWDVHKREDNKLSIFNDHKGFVQGVALDPKGQYVSTFSSDRCLRIYNFNNKKLVHKINKSSLNVDGQQNENATPKDFNLFYDDTLKSYCRRLEFSPDGELLVCPCGIRPKKNGSFDNGIYIFTRSSLSKPVVYLPTLDKYAIAVRFCPKFFELRNINKENIKDVNICSEDMFKLPYRMVFAVATQTSVLIYDTQQTIPLAKISDIHYTRLTDLAWSHDGNILVVSSSDGYCSLVSFTENELGTPYTFEDSPTAHEENIKQLHSLKVADKTPKMPPKKKQNTDGKIPSEKIQPAPLLAQQKTETPPPVSVAKEDKKPTPAASVATPPTKGPRRIQFITLSSPKDPPKKC